MRQQGFPLSFSIIDRTTTQAVGASYMRITPEHRVIEIGNIFYTPALAGTRGATEAMYLLDLICICRSRLPPLRVEMQRVKRALAPRGAPSRFRV
jgi:hypothetical protein